jgi:O-antigen ligase
MPDISFFGWWEYITHNSIIWVWMKTGVFGFVAMLFFVGTSIMTAARAAWRMPGGELSAVVLTSTLYIVMHFIYAYVDMSWDNQSMIYLGALIGLTSSAEYIVRQPVKIRPKRWSWQPDPQPPPGLRP